MAGENPTVNGVEIAAKALQDGSAIQGVEILVVSGAPGSRIAHCVGEDTPLPVYVALPIDSLREILEELRMIRSELVRARTGLPLC